jgi:diguanylate cyclase (GGDEF)-like protein
MRHNRLLRILPGALCALVAASCLAAPLDNALEAVNERGYVSPREALYTLARIQVESAPLSVRQQAQLYEQVSHAKYGARDFSGAVQAGKLLEAFGRQHHDRSIECLGVLTQTYPYWKMGQITTAYALLRAAERYPAAEVGSSVRIKVLLSKAQLESEQQQHAAALAAVAEAVALAAKAHDDALIFMAGKMQANLALAAQDVPLALAAAQRILDVARRSPYPERLVRAKGVEYAVASGAGQTARASSAMAERIQLMEHWHFDEALGRALVDYSDLQLKSSRYAEAAALASQALSLNTVLADEALANRARFNHAIAAIRNGHSADGRAEVERLFGSVSSRAQLLGFLPPYVAALTQAGEVDDALRAGALQQQLESEEALYRAREKSEAQEQIDTLGRLSQLKAQEAANERQLRRGWLVAAILAGAGLVALMLLYRRLRSANQQLYDASNRDALTGLFNRRYTQRYVQALPAGAEGLVMLMDIDHFKQLNDSYGHAAGDEALRAVAARLAALTRREDMVVRWGGEEFLAVLLEAPVEDIATVAARVLAAVSAEPVVLNGVPVTMTVSAGICTLGLAIADCKLNWEEAVDLADQALYLAKRNGRNRVCGVLSAARLTSAALAHGLQANAELGNVKLLQVSGVAVPARQAASQTASTAQPAELDSAALI